MKQIIQNQLRKLRKILNYRLVLVSDSFQATVYFSKEPQKEEMHLQKVMNVYVDARVLLVNVFLLYHLHMIKKIG